MNPLKLNFLVYNIPNATFSHIKLIANKMSKTREYELELTEHDQYVFHGASITNDRNSVQIFYTDRIGTHSPITPYSFTLSCDDDEESIQEFKIKDRTTMFITVLCKEETTATYSKFRFTDLLKVSGSINPTHSKTENDSQQDKSPHVEQQDSVMKYQHWCGTCRHH